MMDASLKFPLTQPLLSRDSSATFLILRIFHFFVLRLPVLAMGGIRGSLGSLL